MTTCVPIRDMKSTADFAALVKQERDVIVTKNGYNAFHCLSEEQYQLLQDQVAKAQLLSRMMLAQKETETEDWVDYNEFASSLRSKYGL